MAVSIHRTAIVDRKAEISKDAEIGAYSVIGPDVKIGKGTRLYPHVHVYGKTEIGENNIFFPGAVIGADPQDLKYKGEDSLVKIGSGNTFREYVTVNKGTEFGGWITEIGNDNLIMAYCHIAHDCILGNTIIMGNATNLGGHVTIESCAVISGLVGIIHFVTIGELAFIGGSSKPVTDIPPFMMGDGHPLKIRNINQVGMERNGYSKEIIAIVRKVFRLIYKEEENVSTLAEEIQEGHELYCPEVVKIFEALKQTEAGKYGRAKEAFREDA